MQVGAAPLSTQISEPDSSRDRPIESTGHLHTRQPTDAIFRSNAARRQRMANVHASSSYNASGAIYCSSASEQNDAYGSKSMLMLHSL